MSGFFERILGGAVLFFIFGGMRLAFALKFIHQGASDASYPSAMMTLKFISLIIHISFFRREIPYPVIRTDFFGEVILKYKI